MISIVSGYYNRKGLFYETLKSITHSNFKDFEFIVVDDCSSPEHRLEDLVGEFPFLKIIRLEKENKWYVNPCIPFNIGIREAKGDIIMLQNPECLHVHDVLSFVNENLTESKYMTISAYGFDPQLTAALPGYNAKNKVPELLKAMPNKAYIGWDTIGWYNHPQFRPVFFHFCSALTRGNMAKLNGFDERFAMGIGYDDDEFTARVRMLGLETTIEVAVSVIHQYHTSVWVGPNSGELCERNRYIVDNYTRKENNYRANTLDLWPGI